MTETQPNTAGDVVGTAADRGLYQQGELSAYSSTERDRLRSLMDAGDASDADLDVLAIVSERSGLDPFLKEIYLVGRKTKTGGYRGEPERWETKWTVQAGIDGLRKVLFRAAEAMGVDCEIGQPIFFGPDGAETRYWTKAMGEHPEAVEVKVRLGGRTGYGVATWDQFVQTKGVYDGKKKVAEEPNSMWKQLGPHMLAKCAKAQAIRDVCDLAAGIYIQEEMDQASNRVQAQARRVQPREVARGSSGLQAALESAPEQAAPLQLSEEALVAQKRLRAAADRGEFKRIMEEAKGHISDEEYKAVWLNVRDHWVDLQPAEAVEGGTHEA